MYALIITKVVPLYDPIAYSEYYPVALPAGYQDAMNKQYWTNIIITGMYRTLSS
ncbi:MAG: hypothetical protein JNM21_13660 [Taibaiella sp.]|nr:hypothetical protein [Taibaiella sp.]